MIISQKGIDLIKHYETFQPKAYICPTGHLTIGYGTVIDEEKERWMKTATLTEEQAEQILAGELNTHEVLVSKMTSGININQSQFDALVSFSFNCGAKALQNSTLIKIIKQDPNSSYIESEFKKWCHGDGEVLPGLQKRRASEAILYNTGILKLF
jgi:lysozyme